MKWIYTAPSSYLNWSCQGEWDPDSLLFSREELLRSDRSVKVVAPALCPVFGWFLQAENRHNLAWSHWPFVPFRRLWFTFFCLPYCFHPWSTCWYLSPTLTCFSAPSPCPLFHPQSFLAPSIQNKLYSDIYAVDEQVCACLLHTIQKGRGGVCVC